MSDKKNIRPYPLGKFDTILTQCLYQGVILTSSEDETLETADGLISFIRGPFDSELIRNIENLAEVGLTDHEREFLASLYGVAITERDDGSVTALFFDDPGDYDENLVLARKWEEEYLESTREEPEPDVYDPEEEQLRAEQREIKRTFSLYLRHPEEFTTGE